MLESIQAWCFNVDTGFVLVYYSYLGNNSDLGFNCESIKKGYRTANGPFRGSM